MLIHNATFTGSFSYNGVDISTITSSVDTSASFATRVASLESTASVLTAASGTLDARVISLESTASILTAASASLSTTSGSLNATSASLSTASGSLNAGLVNVIARTGSFATTGSNVFYGNQIVSASMFVSGSVTATGQIVAQTINVQSVTSSVVYSSGSNVFGNDVSNTQVFTGSMLITGSMRVTGTACFSNTICTPTLSVNSSNPILYIRAGNSETSTIGFTQPAVTGYGGFIKTSTGLGDRYISFGLSAPGTNDDASELIRLDDSGNFGIGSTSPEHTLHVRTNCVGTNATIAQFQNTNCTAGNKSFIRVRGQYTGVASYSAYFGIGQDTNLYIYGNDPSRAGDIVITPSGLIGLNTSSPSAELQVNKNCDVVIAMSNCVGVTSGNRGSLAFYNCATSTVGLIRAAAVTDNVGTELQFYTRPVGGNLTQAMTLSNTGHTGIGITSPSFRLDVMCYSVGQTVTVANFGSCNYNCGCQTYIQIGGPYSGGDGSSRIGSISPASNCSHLVFETHTTTSGLWCERMRITAAGDVLIGRTGSLATSTTTSKLVVGGPVNLGSGVNNTSFPTKDDGGLGVYVGSGANAFQVWDDNQFSYPRFIVQRGGNVGIGASSPSSILELCAATPIMTLNQTTGNSNQGVNFNNGATTYGKITNNAATGIMSIQNGNATGDGYLIRFITDGNERLRLGTTGIACFACQVCAPIFSGCRIVQRNGNVETITATKQFSVAALGCSYICFNINSEFGVPSSTYVMVDLEAVSYGGAGSSGMVYKAVAGGYSGHTIYAGGYHQYCEYVKSRSGMDLIICQGNACWNLYGIQVYNCSSGYTLAGHLRIKISHEF